MSLVSICIPTFNGVSFLPECLNSATAQSYHNFEIVIVDDCSTDGTWELIQEFEARTPHVRAFRNKYNLGLVENWNQCARLAKGEWIKFLFQDDTIRPQCLEKLANAGNTSGRPIIACRRQFIYEEISQETIACYQKFLTTVSLDAAARGKTDIPPEDLCSAALHFGCENFIGEPTAALIRRRVFDEIGFFNPNLIQLCDLEFWLRVGVNFGIAYVPETLADFRLHENSTSSKNSANRVFVADIIDPLILAREFAFSPAFAPLRNYARKQGIDLRKKFYTSLTDQICRAEILADIRGRTLHDSRSKIAALHAVCAPTDLPQYVRAGLRAKLAHGRLKRHFDRHIGWRFREGDRDA